MLPSLLEVTYSPIIGLFRLRMPDLEGYGCDMRSLHVVYLRAPPVLVPDLWIASEACLDLKSGISHHGLV